MGLYRILDLIFKPKRKTMAGETVPEQEQDKKIEEAAEGLLPKKEGDDQQAPVIVEPATEEVAALPVETPEAAPEVPVEVTTEPAVEIPAEQPAAEVPIEASTEAPVTEEPAPVEPAVENPPAEQEVPVVEAPAEPTPVEVIPEIPAPTTKPASACCADIHLATSQKIMKIEEVKDVLNSYGTPYTLTKHSEYSYTVVYDENNKILIRVGWN